MIRKIGMQDSSALKLRRFHRAAQFSYDLNNTMLSTITERLRHAICSTRLPQCRDSNMITLKSASKEL